MHLNPRQQEVVDNIDGPMLVVAGPGTGKTQVLSNRIANILESTDTLPQNILCLTFTENGAVNMRQRLNSIIGKSSYDVPIFTYHAFGSEVIKSNAQYFQDLRLEKPIDDIKSYKIIENILSKMSYSRNLKYYSGNIKDILSTISDLKKALITADKLEQIAEENISAIHAVNPLILECLGEINRLPGTYKGAHPIFNKLLESLKPTVRDYRIVEYAVMELSASLEEAEQLNKSTPLTKWKNRWLTKDADNNFVFTDLRVNCLNIEIAELMKLYQAHLDSNGYYDFDDMILRAIKAINNNDDLRFNLQEKYQYIMLDEFQDTNASQFELVSLITDSPVNEGRPNIMAVGDDDQAIFAFQGAQSSNMSNFIDSFRDTKVVALTENYRSYGDILEFSANIGSQITDRFPGIDKLLKSANSGSASIERVDSGSEAEEFSWVSSKISDLIELGVNEQDVTILAPQHKYLERLVPFLERHNISVAYEKREDILQTPVNIHINMASQLLVALVDKKAATIDELMPKVLSHPSFGIEITEIWKVNWSYKKQEITWLEAALNNDQLAGWVKFFLELSSQVHLMPLEQILDILIGSDSFNDNNSPLKDWLKSQSDIAFYEILQHLSVVRKKIRSQQESSDDMLTIKDFVELHNDYASTQTNLINSHAIKQSDNSVTLQTVFKAKGLEYGHVFIINTHDNVWGSKARGNFNKISLPLNLQHIRKSSTNDDELLRLFFVAITRAKEGLYLSSHIQDDLGKSSPRLKFLNEVEQSDKTILATSIPGPFQKVVNHKTVISEISENIETSWRAHHLQLKASMKSLLTDKLEQYQMSPTHLNSFIDLQYSGPGEFFLKSILQFPQGPMPDGEFGNAIHETLQYYQEKLHEKGQHLNDKETEEYFEFILDRKYITQDQKPLYAERGKTALRSYLKANKEAFSIGDVAEARFKYEGVILDLKDSKVRPPHLNGNIDKLEIDKKSKSIIVVDYKTGKSYSKWTKDIKLHKYKQQLYFYKLLVEGSSTYKDYSVKEGRIDFVEPDRKTGQVNSLILDFDNAEQIKIQNLISAVWQLTLSLNFPEVTSSNNLQRILDFEDSLIASYS